MKRVNILILSSILISLLFSGCVTRHPHGANSVIVPSASLYIRTGNYFDTYPIYRYNNNNYLYKHGRHLKATHLFTMEKYSTIMN